MNKKYLLFILIFVLLLVFNSRCYASSISEIKNCVVTVEPKMSDGSLDITCEMTLKILELNRDSLRYIYLEAPNYFFKLPTELSDNIKSIKKHGIKNIKIELDRKYYEGEEVTIKYSINQHGMYNISWGKCKYLFIPESFTDNKIDNITVKWNLNNVISSNANSQDDNYLIWSSVNNDSDKEIKIKVDYDKTSFENLNKLRQRKYIFTTGKIIFIFLGIILIACIACIRGYGHVHVNNVRKYRFYRYYIRK